MIRTGVFAGSSIKVTITFTDPDTAAVFDVGASVAVQIRPPKDDAGATRSVINVTAPQITTGVYGVSFLAEFPGRYAVRATSTGAQPAVAWSEIEVRSAAV